MEPADPTNRIRFACNDCGTLFRVAAHLAGRRARCRRCGAILVVPDRAAPPRPTFGPVARRIATGLLVLAAVTFAGVYFWGDAIQARRTADRLARIVAQSTRLAAALASTGDPSDWEEAAATMGRLGAEVEAFAPQYDSAVLAALRGWLHHQAEFLRMGGRLQRLAQRARAAVENYRELLWHPPDHAPAWPPFLDQTKDLHQECERLGRELTVAAAAAAQAHVRLVEAQTAAVGQLAAAGIRLEAGWSDAADRLQAVLQAAGGDAVPF